MMCMFFVKSFQSILWVIVCNYLGKKKYKNFMIRLYFISFLSFIKRFGINKTIHGFVLCNDVCII